MFLVLRMASMATKMTAGIAIRKYKSVCQASINEVMVMAVNPTKLNRENLFISLINIL